MQRGQGIYLERGVHPDIDSAENAQHSYHGDPCGRVPSSHRVDIFGPSPRILLKKGPPCGS
jgi:hypothetical protein